MMSTHMFFESSTEICLSFIQAANLCAEILIVWGEIFSIFLIRCPFDGVGVFLWCDSVMLHKSGDGFFQYHRLFDLSVSILRPIF